MTFSILASSAVSELSNVPQAIFQPLQVGSSPGQRPSNDNQPCIAGHQWPNNKFVNQENQNVQGEKMNRVSVIWQWGAHFLLLEKVPD